jgi:hypothetical protein
MISPDEGIFVNGAQGSPSVFDNSAEYIYLKRGRDKAKMKCNPG